MTGADDNTQDLIKNNRESLEALAESDLPANWVARRLLEAVDE